MRLRWGPQTKIPVYVWINVCSLCKKEAEGAMEHEILMGITAEQHLCKARGIDWGGL